MEIVTRKELWDIGNTFYVNELVGYSLQKQTKQKQFFIKYYFIFD